MVITIIFIKYKISTAMVSTSISLNLLSENRSTFRDVSFSSCLNADEEAFVLKLAEENRSPLGSSMSITNENVYLGRKDTEDTEIDVFGAEKYFNEGTNDSHKITNKYVPNCQQKKNYPLNVRMAMPSIRSESSWNIRGALQHHSSRNQQPRKTIKVRGKRLFARNCCNFSCSDKNSVEIHDYVSDNFSNKNMNTGLVTCK